MKKRRRLSQNLIRSILPTLVLLTPRFGLLNSAKSPIPEQACAIYDNLRQFVDQPPESFVSRLAELSASVGCRS